MRADVPDTPPFRTPDRFRGTAVFAGRRRRRRHVTGAPSREAPVLRSLGHRPSSQLVQSTTWAHVARPPAGSPTPSSSAQPAVPVVDGSVRCDPPAESPTSSPDRTVHRCSLPLLPLLLCSAAFGDIFTFMYYLLLSHPFQLLYPRPLLLPYL